jgi:hypothetical protein
MVAMVQRLDARSFFFRSQLSVCSFLALFFKVFRNRLNCHGLQCGRTVSARLCNFGVPRIRGSGSLRNRSVGALKVAIALSAAVENPLHTRRTSHTITRITIIVPTTPRPNIVPPVEHVGHRSHPYRHDGPGSGFRLSVRIVPCRTVCRSGKKAVPTGISFWGKTIMKPVIVGMLLLILGVTVPAFAQEERHEESAKPAAKQEQAKPQKQERQAKPAKQEQAKPENQPKQAKTQKQEQQAKSQEQSQQKQAQQQVKGQQNQQEHLQHQQQATGHAQQSQAQYARSGQKDKYGHEYNESHFGPNHHGRFEASGGREYNGRREYSYGGYWFYAGAYPPWFYQQDVYFIMGADGLWYAVAYGDPSLTFQVYIE